MKIPSSIKKIVAIGVICTQAITLYPMDALTTSKDQDPSPFTPAQTLSLDAADSEDLFGARTSFHVDPTPRSREATEHTLYVPNHFQNEQNPATLVEASCITISVGEDAKTLEEQKERKATLAARFSDADLQDSENRTIASQTFAKPERVEIAHKMALELKSRIEKIEDAIHQSYVPHVLTAIGLANAGLTIYGFARNTDSSIAEVSYTAESIEVTIELLGAALAGLAGTVIQSSQQSLSGLTQQITTTTASGRQKLAATCYAALGHCKNFAIKLPGRVFQITGITAATLTLTNFFVDVDPTLATALYAIDAAAVVIGSLAIPVSLVVSQEKKRAQAERDRRGSAAIQLETLPDTRSSVPTNPEAEVVTMTINPLAPVIASNPGLVATEGTPSEGSAESDRSTPEPAELDAQATPQKVVIQVA